MNVKFSLLMPFFLTALLLVVSCNKGKIICSQEDTFCSFVDKGDFSSTGPIIDKFLSKLNNNLSDDKKLEKLKDWLECKS